MKKNTIDNNVCRSVRIGEQEWMVKNLNVEHFRNGDVIPEAETDEDWEKAGEEERPAWCYYDNDISNGVKYGKLYNWYAVSDLRGLAPEGWHVPTDSEWTELTEYLANDRHDEPEGTALKANTLWNSIENGTDNYGWSGILSGLRSYRGSFCYIGREGCWWSSSRNTIGGAWTRDLNDYNGKVERDGSCKDNGFSVRCLRD